MLLVQRPRNASLMADMWELPALAPETLNRAALLLRVRHSITDTDYRVAVYAISEVGKVGKEARWFTPRQYERLALTGLARKILRKVAGESNQNAGESNL